MIRVTIKLIPEPCGECGGTGEIVNDGPYSHCDDCNGTGVAANSQADEDRQDSSRKTHPDLPTSSAGAVTSNISGEISGAAAPVGGKA
jgi:DnaJ-class molecular chaperone